MNTADSPRADGGPPLPPEASGFAPSWFAPQPGDAASPPAPEEPSADREVSPARLWRVLMGARLLLAAALLGLEAYAWRHGTGPGWIVVLCLLHVAICAVTLAWTGPADRPGVSALRWLPTVWADLLVFGCLELFAPGGINFTPLFVWPVLLAAALGPRLLALGSASAGTLVLLAEAWLAEGTLMGTTQWLQAAVTGSGLLLVAWLSSHLTTRLIGEQTAARRSRQLAQLQGLVNQAIVTGLGEGVVVLDPRGHLWYANRAAAQMLGAVAPDAEHPSASEQTLAALRHTPAWRVLAGWARGPLHGAPNGLVQDLALPLPGGGQRRVRARARAVAAAGQAGGATVVFLEDLHDIEGRVRTEKLAAMGRVSAAVAHEIRNPLAAIAQASALLQEDEASPAQRHLIGLIEQNVRRLTRTVDDVLETARTPWLDNSQTPAPWLALDSAVDGILADWLQQRPQGARLQRHALAGNPSVAFDAEHLRRVLVNLLDNADRHATHSPGAIRVETAEDGAFARLVVWSDSPDIPAPVRDHLFEPFMSSHSRSSGLGLYLSRELCQRYHADLGHERTVRDGREGNAFVVRLPIADASP